MEFISAFKANLDSQIISGTVFSISGFGFNSSHTYMVELKEASTLYTEQATFVSSNLLNVNIPGQLTTYNNRKLSDIRIYIAKNPKLEVKLAGTIHRLNNPTLTDAGIESIVKHPATSTATYSTVAVTGSNIDLDDSIRPTCQLKSSDNLTTLSTSPAIKLTTLSTSTNETISQAECVLPSLKTSSFGSQVWLSLVYESAATTNAVSIALVNEFADASLEPTILQAGVESHTVSISG